MINCLRPSNRSSRLTLPLGPSNSYFFSTTIHGMPRRSAASASRERVKAFSFTRSCCCAASHSCCDTIGGVFIVMCPFECSLSLSLLVAISLSPFKPLLQGSGAELIRVSSFVSPLRISLCADKTSILFSHIKCSKGLHQQLPFSGVALPSGTFL